ncbi:MAG: hypothetical protein AAGA58_03745 [Verrucomicrobiota bacterium]
MAPFLPAAPSTPAPGSKERKDILDALRLPLEDGFKQELIFRVHHFKVENGWGYLEVQPRTKSDKKISYKGTIWQEDADFMDDGVLALMRYRKGRWYVVAKIVGPTDYPLEFFLQFEAPRGIFPSSGDQ